MNAARRDLMIVLIGQALLNRVLTNQSACSKIVFVMSIMVYFPVTHCCSVMRKGLFWKGINLENFVYVIETAISGTYSGQISAHSFRVCPIAQT